MYLSKSIIQGLKILGFEKDIILKVSKEKDLEEIFLSTLFLNYIIILVIYIVGIINGGFSIGGRALNMQILLGMLMIYPFLYNVFVYAIYGFFGLMAELINKKKQIKPLISVGFHTALVYTILFYVIALLANFNSNYSLFLLFVFLVYFIYIMFLSISTIYKFSMAQSLIVVFTPFLIFATIILILTFFFPNLPVHILKLLFA